MLWDTRELSLRFCLGANVLSQYAFPKLKKMCSEQGIFFSEVDLRYIYLSLLLSFFLCVCAEDLMPSGGESLKSRRKGERSSSCVSRR